MTLTIRYLEAADHPQWEAYLQKHPHATLYHSPRYLEVLKKSYHLPAFPLGAWEGDQLVGVLPLSLCPAFPKGKQLVALPYAGAYGALCSDSPEVDQQLLEAAKQLAQKKRVQFVELRELDQRLNAKIPNSPTYSDYQLDLSGGAEAIWKNKLNTKARNQVRKAEKSGLEFKLGGLEYLKSFYEIYASTMHELGSPAHSFRFFSKLIHAFPEAMKVVLIEHEGQAVATLWLCHYKQHVSNPWAGSKRDFWKMCPNNLSYWKSIEWSVEQGATIFDFGRSLREGSHSKFKKQWGTDEVPLGYYYLLNRAEQIPQINPNNPKLQFLTRTWKTLPPPLVQTVGPYLAKRVP